MHAISNSIPTSRDVSDGSIASFGGQQITSGLPPVTDMVRLTRHFRKVPEPEVAQWHVAFAEPLPSGHRCRAPQRGHRATRRLHTIRVVQFQPGIQTRRVADSWFGQIGWRAAVRPLSRRNWRYPASAGLRRRSSQAQRSAGWSRLDRERRHVGACARVMSDAPLLRWQKHTG